MHNDSVVDSYGKFLVGIGTGFIVFVGAFMLWVILDNLGFPVASAQQASAQMLYFMLTGWGAVSFVSHLQKGLHKKVEVSEGLLTSGGRKSSANGSTRTSTSS